MSTAANFDRGLYQISGAKFFKGHEGEPCLQGSLKFGKKTVCEFTDDSSGGEMHVRFNDVAAKAAFLTWALQYHHANLYDSEAARPTTEAIEKHPECVIDDVLSDMALQGLQMKEIAKYVKNNILAYEDKPIRGEAPEWASSETTSFAGLVYSQGSIDYVNEKYPVAKGFKRVILNEKAGQPLTPLEEAKFIERERFLDTIQKKYTKKMAHQTVFLAFCEKTGKELVYTNSMPYSPLVESKLREKYGDRLRVIFNTRKM